MKSAVNQIAAASASASHAVAPRRGGALHPHPPQFLGVARRGVDEDEAIDQRRARGRDVLRHQPAQRDPLWAPAFRFPRSPPIRASLPPR